MRILLTFLTLFTTILSCSDSNPIFQEVTKGRAEVIAIEITPDTMTIDNSSTNQKFTVYAKYQDETKTDVTAQAQWISTDTTIGTVNQQGYFQIRNIGQTTITAAFQGFMSNTATITVSGYSIVYVDKNYTGITDGTKTQPFNTITDAVNHAKDIGARRINVAKGNYTELIQIDRDISLYGGYEAMYNGDDWMIDTNAKPSDTTITSQGTITIQYSGGLTSSTTLRNFRITGSTDATNNSSIAIFIQQASPTIEDNEIFAGTCTGISVAILNQTASPIIKNNSIISGGLPVENGFHTGGGADNIAILNQSFSSPTIQGTRTNMDSSQVITGPTGGENTFRIKCESSSNPNISGNKIELLTDQMANGDKVKGILAIGSSPVIENNIVSSTENSRLAIRGENTSFQIKNSNHITGSIEVTSNSTNVIIDSNEMIDGDINVSGASTEISITNHYGKETDDCNFIAHYGKCEEKRIGKVTFDATSRGTLQDNASDIILVLNNSYVQIHDNIVKSSELTGIRIEAANANISRNYIEVINNYNGTISGIKIENNTDSIYILNNIIYAKNLNNSNSSSISNAAYLNHIGGAVRFHSNLLVNEVSHNNANNYGIFIVSFTSNDVFRFINNIFYSISGLTRYGIYNTDSDNEPRIIAGNYFLNTHYLYNEYSSHSTLNSHSVDYTLNNTTSLSNTHWINTNPSKFIEKNFNIANSSTDFYNKGVNVQAMNPDYVSRSTEDFYKNTRTITENVLTGEFSVGPFEYFGP